MLRKKTDAIRLTCVNQSLRLMFACVLPVCRGGFHCFAPQSLRRWFRIPAEAHHIQLLPGRFYDLLQMEPNVFILEIGDGTVARYARVTMDRINRLQKAAHGRAMRDDQDRSLFFNICDAGDC